MRILAFALLAGLAHGAALAQGAPSPAPAGGASSAERLDKLERDLEAAKAELRDLKDKRATQAKVAAGGPSAAAQGEKFEKKFGRDVVATWANGFSLLFLDEKEEDPERRVLHRLAVNGRVQADYRDYLDEHHPLDDRFFLRRARISFSGTYFRHLDFLLESELGQFTSGIAEAWVQLSYWKPLQLRVGQVKEPFSLERYGSSRYLNFLERSMAKRWTAIDFDVGAMLWGDLRYAIWQVAAVNGTGTQTNDNNDDKDLCTHLILTPVRPGGDGPLQGVFLGGAFTAGKQTSFLPTYRTELDDGAPNPSSKSTFFTFPATATQDGYRYRYGLEGRIDLTPITIQGEYTYMDVEGARASASASEVDFSTRGGFVDFLVMLTGEEYLWSKRVIPKASFDPLKGQLGAVQLAARYDYVHIENDARKGLGATGADRVNALVLGLNWYLTPMVKVQLNYNRNWFNRPAANTGEKDEDVLGVRLAMEF